MNTVHTQAAISDREFACFQRLIHELAGIHLSDAKKQLVFGRLRNRVTQLGLGSFEEYYLLLKGSAQASERQMLVDLLTTNETYFFREPRHFDILREEILPQRESSRIFRIWSAACSSGEEPYSLAMMLADQLGLSRTISWEIVASDISQRVLDKARTGHYPMQRIDGIPQSYLQKYCLKGTGAHAGTLLIDAPLRERVRFERINLNETLPRMGRFELVFLRNMLIYFQADTKEQIVRRVVDQLEPGGWLIVGQSETLKSIDERLVQHSPSVYRRTSP